jgi:hypothetical protein
MSESDDIDLKCSEEFDNSWIPSELNILEDIEDIEDKEDIEDLEDIEFTYKTDDVVIKGPIEFTYKYFSCDLYFPV